jgi:cobalt-zinc-cadmium efflux system outer membrane protein
VVVRGRRVIRAVSRGLILGLAAGCTSIQSPLPEDANIRRPVEAPELPAPPAPAPLPEPPPKPKPPAEPLTRESGPLLLTEVLLSTQANFPLLYAVEQERVIAEGQRTAAEGQFDTAFRMRGYEQAGTFSNGNLDIGLEQPLPLGGITTFGGWRLGQGNYPVYYGNRKTADGGEFRAGVMVPLLQNRDIDPRRARLRAAQIAEQITNPVIRRARLDYFRNAAQNYWSWVGAGAQYRVAEELLRLARDRQTFIDEQFKQKLVSETIPVLNRRLIASREEHLLASERGLQQAAFRLSLFLRDGNGDPVVPSADWLPPGFLELAPPTPAPANLEPDVATALQQRPELVRFQLMKERIAVDLKLATNQMFPQVNVFAAAAQDAGFSKKTFTGDGPFTTDRTNAEIGLEVAVPLQRRDPSGRTQAAQAQLAQLLAQERFARDEITTQVQDAVSELVQTFKRVEKARVELREAIRVRELETESFRAGRTSLVDLNLQEIAAAEAQAKVVGILASYYRSVADYLAAIGVDPADASGNRGRVLPQTELGERLPAPPKKP